MQVTAVTVWSGRDARALREARRMSVREFAAHLGVSDRMVSKWEAGGDAIRPRSLNQSALDTSLLLADAETKRRFERIFKGHEGPPASRNTASEPRRMSKQAIHLVRHPLDHKLMTFIGSGPFRVGPGRKPFWLPGYYVDVQPTTNAEYARFLAATGWRAPSHWPDGLYTIADDPDALHHDPVADLNWDDAVAYALWATKELPTTVQWDRANRGAEGMVAAELKEWVRAATGPRLRGKTDSLTGGFRCVSPLSRTLSLLAI
jgi:formylglycine-generating enzyme required for sulfatase activity